MPIGINLSKLNYPLKTADLSPGYSVKLSRTIPVLTALCFQTAVASEPRNALDIIKEKCQHCHGLKGEASNSIYPRLAGQNAAYIAKQLADFQSGRRKGTMNEMVKGLTADEMRSLGEYFAAQPPKSHRVFDKALAAVGYYLYHKGNRWNDLPSCASCHGENGSGSETLPRLAGQHKHYLVQQLDAFKERTRTNDNAIMFTIQGKLTEMERVALALYISGLKGDEEK